jgi:phosphatidylglycerol:prolipoprotein diacylglycerol transferase
MRQVLFRIPGLGITVYGFGFMVVVACLAGWLLAGWRARREKLDPDLVSDLSVWLILGGLVGARLFYVVEYWGETVTSVGQAFRVWEGGIVFYGSVLGASAAFFVFRAFRAFPVLATLDALAPSVALGIALGRLGCFLNGCCYGGYCRYPWLAVRFPRNSLPWVAERARMLISRDATHTLPLHPTQLYETLNGLILFALLTASYPLRRRDGEIMALLMLAYSVTRFLIDTLRDDESPLVSGMTIAQTSSLILFAAGMSFWSYLSNRPASRLADPQRVDARA